MELQTPMAEASRLFASGNGLQFTIDVLAVLIGIFAIAMAVRINRQLGGKINQALRFFILGVLSNVLAILWSLLYGLYGFYGHVYEVFGMNFDVHQNLMTLGMLFFIISTARFSRLVH